MLLFGGGLIIVLLVVACAVWVIYDACFIEKNNFSTTRKILWAVLAICFSVITAILYYLIEKKDRNRRSYNFLP